MGAWRTSSGRALAEIDRGISGREASVRDGAGVTRLRRLESPLSGAKAKTGVDPKRTDRDP